ncbi:lateral signaling target protein 2 homolog [Punica granatum]|uniref:Uncharacterized protein n=2 Tax=Punica granatum TaxID=22663 RepID=A0A218WBD1_PUNGR|nr:lateral signaling target protein 2 homolog [Punica granatum]OWM69843.1 hypothetical protein CDL15_Pgr025692 [Punica granatum]PKI31281.1 hypothetical protein CRG98_048328 [Punica granatum]
MEVAMEMEDDLFFADLSKQINLLIMEEDDGVEEEPVAPYWQHSSSLQGFSRAANVPLAPSLASAYEQINCRREISKGTGVFIPKCSQPRGKNRQGRFGSSAAPRSHRQISSTDHHHHHHHHQYNGLSRSGPSHINSFHPKK